MLTSQLGEAYKKGKLTERHLGKSVISAERAIDHTNPSGTLPLNEAGDFYSDEELI